MRFLLALIPISLAAATHPLTPLSAPEIRSAAEIIRADSRVPQSTRFSTLALDEPAKNLVLSGGPVPRRAFAVLYDYESDRTWEAVANLDTRKLDRLQEIPGAEPVVTGDDSMRADQIVRSDPRWRRALLARGIRDLNTVAIIAWTAGYFALPGTEKGRIVRALPYSYDGNNRNFYAHPIEGIVAHVNLTTGQVIDFTDTGSVPVPRESAELSPAFNLPLREAAAPLVITQPNGPGFHIEDGEVHWQKWRFRWAMHPREGLVLYTVGYEDGGKVRSILYRASLSEMVVPYGDPSQGWYFRNSFDAGELGLGINASPLTPGVDCPQNCSVYDAVLASPDGQPIQLRRAVALYERDGAYVWKHEGEARHARDLVLSYVSTVGNYDYGFEYVFHQDGAIDVRVLLTGVMAAKAIAANAHDPYSHPVGRNLAAPHHQHFFAFRLDMDVDGAAANRVVEMNSAPAPAGKTNTFGGAFEMHETPLATERAAMRNLNLASGRKWIVQSSTRKNALGMPTGFALLPGENATAFLAPESWVRKRAPFLDAHVWVTPYRAGELYAAGDYPNQSRGGDGLARWTRENRPVDNTDVVLWYTLGITHNPRPEDWPVMPVHAAGFRLVPWGFFDRNPAMDMPVK